MKKNFLLLIAFLGLFYFNATAQICTPAYDCSAGDFINNFSTTGGNTNISNLNSGCTATGYQYYSTQTVTINLNDTVNFSVQSGPSWSQGFGIWVDWNNNGSFLDAGEFVWNSGTSGTTVFTGSFIAPITATSNTNLRMRVVAEYATVPQDPCSQFFNFGEAEDYNLYIIGLPCTAPPVAGNAVASDSNACAGTTVNFSLQGNTVGAGMGYQWQLATVGASGPWSNLAGDTLPSMSKNQTVTSWYRCILTCNSQSDTSSIVNVVTSYNPLNGMYTINPALPGSSTNFQSINSAIQNLSCHGVSGQVTFILAPGVHNERVILGQIPGSSPTNRVIFDGVDTATTTISFAPIFSAERAIIVMDGTKHVTFRNITVRSTGSFGWCFFLTNETDSIEISNNRINPTNNSTSSLFAGIIASGSQTSNTTQNKSATNLTIQNNEFIGGYYGVSLYGQLNNNQLGNRIIGNTFRNVFYFGIYLVYQNAPQVIGNNVEMFLGSTFNYAIYLNQVDHAFNISKNKIINPGSYAIYIATGNLTAASRPRISNNMIGGGFQNATGTNYGIYFSNVKNVDIWYNSINVDNGNGMCLYITSATTSTGIDVRNNSFAYTGIGNGYAMYVLGVGSLSGLNYNNYFSSGSFVYYGVERPNLQALQAANFPFGNDQNSHVGNPLYISPTNLVYYGSQLESKGIGIPQLTDDIFGSPRPTTGATDIGAYQSLPCTAPPSAGTLVVTDTNVCTSQTVNFSLNGASMGSGLAYQWQSSTFGVQGSWVNLPTDTLPFMNKNLTASLWFRCVVSCSNVSDTSNSVHISTTYNPLSGNYSVDPNLPATTTNYQNFSDLIADLNCSGVSGPVTITVAPGLYNTQVNFGSIYGSSPTNRVTIDGIDKSITSISFSPTLSLERYVVSFNGTKNLTLKNFTIQSTGPSFGWVVFLTNGCDSIEIKDNKIVTNAVVNSSLFAGIVASGSSTSITTQGNTAQNLTIENNEIVGGYYGITLYGTNGNNMKGNRIINNKITATAYYAMYIGFQDATKIRANDITMRVQNNFNYAIFINTLDNDFDISKNIIRFPGTYGIYLANGNISKNLRGRISNNMIGGNFQGTGSPYGLFLTASSNIDVWYNSVNVDNGTGGFGLYVTTGTSSTGLNVRNNSFAYTGGGTGYAMYIVSAASISACNYNNYYSTGSNFVYYTSARVDLAALQGANTPPGNDLNSKQGDPMYIGTNNLRHFGMQLYQSGVHIPTLLEDAFGNARPTSGPDIGAFQTQACTTAVAGTASATRYVVCPFQVFFVQLDSFTFNPTAQLQWQSSSDNINWTNIQNATVPNHLGLQSTSTYYRATLTCAGVSDTSNSVFVYTPTQALNGNYTINPSLPPSANNFVSFGDFVSALNCQGVTGPVVANVSPGVYNEQIVFGPIVGVSNINTVTINGGSADSVKLSFEQNMNDDRYTIRFDFASYITIKNIHIEAAPGGVYGWGVHFTNSTSNILIDSCKITTDLFSTSTNYHGVVVSASGTQYNTAGDNAHFIKISNSLIDGGYTNAAVFGESFGKLSGIVFEKNNMQNAYYYGLLMENLINPSIKYNTIKQRQGGTTIGQGVNLNSVVDGFVMEGNTINNQALFAVHLVNSGGTANQKAYFVNNSIGAGFNNTSANVTGLRLVGTSAHINIQHNSINMDSPSGAALNVTATTANNLDVRNNSFTHFGGANGLAISFPHENVFIARNYNNYFSLGNNLAFNANNVTSLSALQSAGRDSNSISVDPIYISNLHLFPTMPFLDSMGTPITSVPLDILENVRDTSFPDIGAYEYIAPTCIQPLNVHVSFAGDTNAVLSWTTYTNSIAFEIELDTSGFTKNNGTLYYGTSNNTMIGGLTPNTTYDFYVRAICSIGDSSIWVGPFTFTTACPVQQMPFAEGFNTGVIPACWNTNSSQAIQNGLWKFGMGVEYGAVLNGKTPGTYAWVDGSAPSNITDVTLYSPLIDLSGINTPVLSFDLFSNNIHDLANMKFYVSVWIGSQWVDSIYYFSGNNANWFTVTVDISSYTLTGPVQFKFVVDKTVSAGSAIFNDILLDSVYLFEQCPILPLQALISGDTIGCKNISSIFTSPQNPGLVEWYTDAALTNLIDTGINLTHAFTSSGNHTIYSIAKAGVCSSAIDSFSVFIHDEPQINSVSVSAPQSCTVNNGSINISASGGSGTILYSVNGGFSYTTDSAFSTLGQGNYTVQISDSICTAYAIVDSTYNFYLSTAAAAPSVSFDSLYCFGDTLNTNTVTSSGNLFIWFDNMNLNNPIDTGLTYTPTVSAPGNYSYYVVNVDTSNCVSLAAEVKFSIKALPPTPTTTNASICIGTPSGILGSAGNGTLFNWYATALLDSVIGTGNSLTVSAGGVGTTPYYTTQTDNFGCTSSAATANLIVNALPATPSTSADTSFCINNIQSVSVNGSGGTFTWYNNSGLTNPLSMGTVYSPSISSSGLYVYYATETDNNGCVSLADSIVVTVNTIPSAPIASSDTAYCIGDSIVNISVSGTQSNFAWYSDASLTNLLGTSTTLLPSNTIGTNAYYVTQIDNNNCQSNPDTVIVSINALPTVFYLNPGKACANSGLVNLGGGFPLGGNYSSPFVSNNQFNVNNSGSGLFQVTYTYTDANGCVNSANNNFRVDALPSVSLAGFNDDCEGYPAVALSGGMPIGGTYTGIGVDPNTQSFDPSIGAGNYMITYTFTNSNGCTAKDSASITVHVLPTVSFTPINPVCLNSGTFTLSGGSPAGGVYSGAFVLNNTFDPFTAGVGTSTVSYTITDTNGCANSVDQPVVVNAIPNVVLTNFARACLNDTTFALYGGLPAGGIYSGNGVTNNYFDPFTAGAGSSLITYTYTDANNCTNFRSVNLIVNNNPNPAASVGNDTTVCSGFSISIYAGPGSTYQWSNGAFGSSITLDSNGVYVQTITVTVSDDYGCQGVASKTITRTEQECVGVNELKHSHLLDIYPNPTQGTIYLDAKGLQGEDAYISITNLQGQVVYTERLGVMTENMQKEINLNREAKGVYFVRLYSDNYNLVHRIVIN